MEREKPIQAIEVHGARCLNARSNLSHCNYCESVCPAGALDASASIFLGKISCEKCGLCLAACPAQVFTTKDWDERDALKALHRRKEHAQVVRLACPEAAQSLGPFSQVEHVRVCLAAFSPGALFEAAVGREISLSVHECVQCHIKQGMKLIAFNVRLVNSWLSGLEGQEPIKLIAESADNIAKKGGEVFLSGDPLDSKYSFRRESDVGFARRGSRLFSAIKEQAQAAKKEETFITGNLTPQFTPTWRTALAAFWESKDELSEVEVLWPSVEIDAETCVGCGACRQYCSTGAIRQERQGDNLVVTYTPGLCIDCGICALSCMQQALKRGYKMGVQPFKAKQIFSAAMKPCIRCSSPVLTGEDLCYWCAAEPNIDKLMDSLRQKLLRKEECGADR